MEIHDNEQGGLQVPAGAAPKCLGAGRSVSMRHGNAHDQKLGPDNSMVSGIGMISTNEKDAQKVEC